MSDALVERLREEVRKCEQARHTHWVDPDMLRETADEIERLRAALREIEQVRRTTQAGSLRQQHDPAWAIARRALRGHKP